MSHIKNSFLSPYQFPNGLTSKNRLALAPMTNGQSSTDGSLGEDEFKWLERRAKGGFGIVITCASHISKQAKGWEGELGVFDAKHESGLRRLSTMMRKEGALSFVQLFHGGARSPSLLTGVQPISASAFHLEVPGFEEPREAAESEIEEVIASFVEAASRAIRSGFDGVEIHGANGYLITQFLSTATNFRNDKWGGSLENRMRLALEVVKGVREKIGDKKLLSFRLSPENFGVQTGLDIDEMLQVAKRLGECGVDVLHLSLSSILKRPAKYPDSTDPMTTLFRNVLPTRVALMASGSVWTVDDAESALDSGVDLVSIGKAAISHPDWIRETAKSSFVPRKFPLPPSYLKTKGVGEGLIKILDRMKLLASDDK